MTNDEESVMTNDEESVMTRVKRREERECEEC